MVYTVWQGNTHILPRPVNRGSEYPTWSGWGGRKYKTEEYGGTRSTTQQTIATNKCPWIAHPAQRFRPAQCVRGSPRVLNIVIMSSFSRNMSKRRKEEVENAPSERIEAPLRTLQGPFMDDSRLLQGRFKDTSNPIQGDTSTGIRTLERDPPWTKTPFKF